MILHICKEGKAETAEKCLLEMTRDSRVQAVLVLACDANGWTKEGVDPWIRACRIPVFGGIFPQILADGQNLEKGFLMAGLFHPVEILVLTGTSRPGMDFDTILEEGIRGMDFHKKTLFAFVDGLSRRIEALLQGLFNSIGLIPNYIGGGAGSLSFIQKPCIITPMGLLMDAAVLALSAVPSSIGVAHGWSPISEAVKVTESRQNRIISLNWEPAFTVYRRIVERHSRLSFESTPFFDIARAYPLGIARMDAEMVVRDPIFTEYEALICVGEVPEGTYVHVMNGDMRSLIAGAEEARKAAFRVYTGKEDHPVLFLMDCISRVLFMEEHFKLEILALSQNGCTFGALSLGEIANTGESSLEFYNKTVVAGLLGDAHES